MGRRSRPSHNINGSVSSSIAGQKEVGVDNVASSVTSEGCAEYTRPLSGKGTKCEVIGDFRLAWLWAEGWRARLRKSGDIVEKARWEWRMDDMIGHPNKVPIIVAKVPGASVLKSPEVKPDRPRQKSVHWL